MNYNFGQTSLRRKRRSSDPMGKSSKWANTQKEKKMNMQTLLAGVLMLGLPAVASANDVEWSGEVGVNAATSDGATETTANAAVEMSFGGAFIGAEVETLYQDPADNAEFTVTLGHSFDISNDTALTASYARIYLDNSGFSSHEAALALDFPITGDAGGTLEVVRDLTAKITDVSLGAEFGLGNNFTGAALVGHDGAIVYGEAGLAFEISENVSAGLLVELEDGAKPVYNFGITIGFGS
jgi:hypothetical protein